jgi:hypothetical protein
MLLFAGIAFICKCCVTNDAKLNFSSDGGFHPLLHSWPWADGNQGDLKLMWIVQVALRRPYTFLVMALLILLATPLVLLKMPTDIFPDINIPVISIVWNYTGLSAQ